MTSAVVQVFVVTFNPITCYSEHGTDLSQGQMDGRGGDGRRLHVQFLLVQKLQLTVRVFRIEYLQKASLSIRLFKKIDALARIGIASRFSESWNNGEKEGSDHGENKEDRREDERCEHHIG